MNLTLQTLKAVATAIALATVFFAFAVYHPPSGGNVGAESSHGGTVTIHSAAKYDLSRPLGALATSGKETDGERDETEQQPPPRRPS
jgi:hypothetical protein